jgi:DNA-binding YbaB/EbfC family protein
MKGGMQQLMKQANQLQLKIKKIQDELSTREYEAVAGGEAVKVRVQGESRILAVEISEELMKSGDVEMLQDLVVTAANEALRKAKETQAAEMEKVTGGFGFPGL